MTARILALSLLLSAVAVGAVMAGGFGGGGASATGLVLGDHRGASQLRPHTVAMLPRCGATNTGQVAFIEDAQDQRDTTDGGGTTMIVAVCNGEWSPLEVTR